MSIVTPAPDPQVKTVRDLVPIQDHPPAAAVRSIYIVAKRQMRASWQEYRDSNAKARKIRENLTPEQLYIYEWINYIFVIMALPHESFARQCGSTVQTLKSWLKKKGHLPSRTHFRRLLAIYDTNFCDEEARKLLHGDKIGLWWERQKTGIEIWKEKWSEYLNNDKKN